MNLRQFRPVHSQNRMRHEGDLYTARDQYLSGKNANLMHLLRSRFTWMNDFLDNQMIGLEIGAGIGASKNFISNKNLSLSDVGDSEWLDFKHVDALNLPFAPDSYDYIIASNMLHHVAEPKKFFVQMSRVLKQNGLLLLIEANTSIMSRLILRIMRHEGFDEDARVFEDGYICNDPDDPWSANCSIPKLLFENKAEFHKNFPEFEIIHDVKVEFITFLNSGGVTAKFYYVPLYRPLLKLIDRIDYALIKMAPDFFALGRQVVIRKRITSQV